MSVKVQAEILTLRYLFGEFNLETFRVKFANLTGEDFTRAYRTAIVRDPDVMYNLKFALYAAFGSDDPDGKAVEFGLLPCDASCVGYLNDKELAALFARLRANKHKPLSIDFFKNEVARAWTVYHRNAEGFVRYKLRFLRSSGELLEHMVNDCMSRTYEQMLVRYPLFQSRLHFDNLFKLAFRQAGLKIIKYHTAQSRSAFDTNGQLRKFTDLYATTDGDLSVYDTGVDSRGLTGDDEYASDAILTVRQVLSNALLTDQDHQVIALLAGGYDAQFLSWLRKIDRRSPENIQADDPDTMVKHVCNYVGCPEWRLRWLRNLFSGKSPSVKSRHGKTLCVPPNYLPLGWTSGSINPSRSVSHR